MPEREQKKKPAPKERANDEAEVAAPVNQGEALKEELDDLLDEIDSVLEVNAEEFVRSYVQKGGE
ncbi:MAG: ubiquitin-like protein Pup [Actinobacteria bacterium]|nr:ubiquitin-like protein Pup [Actinomycetota bacterium]